MNTYRVWMKDGYCGLYNGESEEEAKTAAIDWARNAVDGAAMSPRERRAAITVDYAEKLN